MRVALHVDLGRQPPTEFRIFPAGVVSTVKGAFLFDDQAAASVMAAYQQHAVDFTIDYDHHTLATASGVRAISAGWFALDLRDGELWATSVRWTSQAAEYLRSAEYRYFSPLFDCDPQSGRITGLINAGLTNTPAIDGLEALVAASATHHRGGSMFPSTSLSDDVVSRAYRAAHSAGALGATAQVALSAVGGSVQVRGVLEQASDVQLINAMNPVERQMMKTLAGESTKAMGAAARKGALRALSRLEGDAGALLVDAARSQVAR